MMNSSSGGADYIDSIANSFFEWFHRDILPVCSAIVDSAIIVTGVVLNVLLLVAIRKRGLLNEPSSHFIVAFCVADFACYALLLLPSVIAAAAGDWLLSDPVCHAHGAFLFFFVFVNFGLVSVLSVERCIKLVREDDCAYDALFESTKVRNGIIIAVFALGFVLSFLPVTGLGEVVYDSYHIGCKLDYARTPAFLFVHFVFTFTLSLVAVCVCYALIFDTRRKAIIKNRLIRQNLKKKKMNQTNTKDEQEPLAAIQEDENNIISDKQAFVAEKEKTKRSAGAVRKRRSKSSPRNQSLLFEVFSDEAENPAFHLSITYLSLWATIVATCLPYTIFCFYDLYDGPLWGGFYTIGLLVLHLSFVLKPVVYIGHNRRYKELTRATIPESMKNGARAVRSSITGVAGKMEDFLFKSRTNRRFQATLAAHKAVLIWKKKIKKSDQVILTKIPEKLPESADLGAETKQGNNIADPAKIQSGDYITHTNQPGPRITPSEINVNPTPSTYIDRERLRLLNARMREIPPPGQPSNVSPVPGMVPDPGSL